MEPLIRRIRKSEKTILKDFFDSPNIDSIPFEHHRIWLTKVLTEFESGSTRAVFGAFHPVYEEVDSADHRNELIGCVFLKKSEYDDVIELKSLITAKSEYLEKGKFRISKNHHGLLNEVKTSLIEKAIRFCEAREFPKIEMELLHDDMRDEISLLLKLGFRLSYLREKYSKGKLIYVLEKTIGDTYQADPFDEIKISRWFIQRVLSCKILDDKTGEVANVEIIKIPFKRELIRPAGLKEHDACNFQLTGELFIVFSSENSNVHWDQVFDAFNANSRLRFVFVAEAPNSSLILLSAQRNVEIITSEFLKCFAGGEKSSLTIPFGIEEIGGVITVLERSEILRYCEWNHFAYFLISGIGSKLSIPDGQDNLLGIYCPHWDERGGAIVGYCEIEGLKPSKFQHAHKAYKDIPQALAEDDLKYYKKFGNSNDQIVVLRCKRIQIFDAPITLNDFKSEYLINQIGTNFASAAYLDIASADLLRRRSSRPIKSKQTVPLVELKVSVQGESFNFDDNSAHELIARISKTTGIGSIYLKEVISDRNKLILEMAVIDSEKLFWEIKRRALKKIGVNDAFLPKKTAQAIIAFKRSAQAFDTFLCHNSKDKESVIRIGKRLQNFGILPWLDEWEIKPGALWQKELEMQIESIKSVTVFVGGDGIGPWQNLEIDGFLRHFVNRKCSVIPVILQSCHNPPQLPVFLGGLHYVDFKKLKPEPFSQLLWGITGIDPRRSG